MLVETVQSALRPPKVSKELTERQEGQPAACKELSWKIQCRLHKRGWALINRGKLKSKVTVALAREMAGFVWAMLQLVPAPTPPPAGPVLRRA